jgi:hypothetical protein
MADCNFFRVWARLKQFAKTTQDEKEKVLEEVEESVGEKFPSKGLGNNLRGIRARNKANFMGRAVGMTQTCILSFPVLLQQMTEKVITICPYLLLE